MSRAAAVMGFGAAPWSPARDDCCGGQALVPMSPSVSQPRRWSPCGGGLRWVIPARSNPSSAACSFTSFARHSGVIDPGACVAILRTAPLRSLTGRPRGPRKRYASAIAGIHQMGLAGRVAGDTIRGTETPRPARANQRPPWGSGPPARRGRAQGAATASSALTGPGGRWYIVLQRQALGRV